MFAYYHKITGLALTMLTVLLLVYPNIGWSQNQVMLPLLSGQSWQQASQRLAALGLEARRVPPRQPCDDELRINQVISQHPEAGSWLPRGGRVTLVTCAPVVVSLERQVPDLNGLTLAQAKVILQKLNLKMRYSFNHGCLDPFLQGKVIKQQPPPNSQLRRGSIVWISICQGTP